MIWSLHFFFGEAAVRGLTKNIRTSSLKAGKKRGAPLVKNGAGAGLGVGCTELIGGVPLESSAKGN